jgi:nucleoside-diphosphate-sugar epimerase
LEYGVFGSIEGNIRLILATGTSGTIGRHLSNFVSPISKDLEEISNKEFNVYSEEFTLLHLAGIVGTNAVLSDINYSREINVNMTLKLASIAREGNLQKFVYISSSHIYGSSSIDLQEDSVPNPQSEYAEQKLEAEIGLTKLFQDAPEKLLIIRVFSVLDIDMPEFTLGGAIAKICGGDSSIRISNSDDERDFMTPHKIANALIGISEKQGILGIFNLCTQKALTVKTAGIQLLTSRNIFNPEQYFIQGNSFNPRIVGSNEKLMKFIPDLDLNWPQC